MKKRILILRHAKALSLASDNFFKDKDRSLSKKGREDASTIGRMLSKENLGINILISSDAARTKETSEIIEHSLNISTTEYTDKLYNASLTDMRNMISKLNDTINTIMIVGHNPTISFLVEYLTGEQAYLSTANVALIRIKN